MGLHMLDSAILCLPLFVLRSFIFVKMRSSCLSFLCAGYGFHEDGLKVLHVTLHTCFLHGCMEYWITRSVFFSFHIPIVTQCSDFENFYVDVGGVGSSFRLARHAVQTIATGETNGAHIFGVRCPVGGDKFFAQVYPDRTCAVNTSSSSHSIGFIEGHLHTMMNANSNFFMCCCFFFFPQSIFKLISSIDTRLTC